MVNSPTEIEVDGLELVFPWGEWKKGEPFRIEMFEDYYEKVREIFPQDWAHKITKAPMLKIQHPETELYSGGVHAANGVSCADCHMPYVRKELGLKYVVITSVTRDDLPDGGANHFAKTIEEIRKISTDTKIEILTPDFKGDTKALNTIINAGQLNSIPLHVVLQPQGV